MSSLASPDAAQVARAWGDLFRYQLGEPDALERMQALLALGADPNDYGPQRLRTSRRHAFECRAALRQVALDRHGQLQRSAVCLICQRHISSASTDLLVKVLRMGADPNAPDLLGRTPLVYLLSQLNGDNPADLAVVKIMLRNGADPRICDNQGQDLFSAIKNRPLPITTDFLRQAIVDLDARELEQATPVSPPRSSAPRL